MPALATLAAKSPKAFVPVGVGLIELMPVQAVSLGRVYRGERPTPKQVLPVGDGLKVIGVDAIGIEATSLPNVVNLHTFGDGPDQEFVGHAVSHQPPPAIFQSAVAVAVEIPSPQPARIG